MTDKLLFWIEAMNLIDAVIECSPLLEDAEDWLKRVGNSFLIIELFKQIISLSFQGKQQPDLMQYLEDAKNFSTFFAGSPAAKSTPHLYISALSTWYQQSPVWTHWKHWFAFIPSISLRHAIMVPLLTMTTNGSISCIALSGNGDLIVSGSHDQSVHVWDAKTGEQLRELQGHTGCVISVAISPDGNQIVSGSHDLSVRVWDAKTGEQLRELQSYTNDVNSVVFSPDSNKHISSSGDQSPLAQVNLSLDSSCIVCTDGWILSDTKHLIWIPQTIRKVLCHPYNTLIISRNGSATISFANSKLGHSWHECYTP